MDNYFKQCPPKMNDSRGFTDYRSSQVREEFFRHNNCLKSENETRLFRTDNADVIIDNEWESILNKNYCRPNKYCYHLAPTTRVTNEYNTAELLSYNGKLPKHSCSNMQGCQHYRATETTKSMTGKKTDNSVKITPTNYKCPFDESYSQNIPSHLYPTPY